MVVDVVEVVAEFFEVDLDGCTSFHALVTMQDKAAIELPLQKAAL